LSLDVTWCSPASCSSTVFLPVSVPSVSRTLVFLILLSMSVFFNAAPDPVEFG
jgi:hypothetical protein